MSGMAVRIVCDTRLRTPLTAQVVTDARQVPTILATCCDARDRHLAYENAGCRIVVVDEKEGHVDLQQLMERLGDEQIDSILLEGGGTLNWAALQSGIVQRVQAYIAPKLFGGETFFMLAFLHLICVWQAVRKDCLPYAYTLAF